VLDKADGQNEEGVWELSVGGGMTKWGGGGVLRFTVSDRAANNEKKNKKKKNQKKRSIDNQNTEKAPEKNQNK